jgi:hypothetical protein
MLSSILHAALRIHPRRIAVARLLAVLVLLLGATALPANAADGQLPPVNNFATARFKLLSTVQIGGEQGVAFGGGTVVLPDRTYAWIGTNESSELTEVVQIGAAIYQRSGGQPWERSDDAPFGNAETQPVSAQFNVLQVNANAILDLGAANVGDVPTMHYQVWLSGDKALAVTEDIAGALPGELRDLIQSATFKYDFWIGTQDGFLHQQLITVIIPAGVFSGVDLPEIQVGTLITFFDINNPNISVNAPI